MESICAREYLGNDFPQGTDTFCSTERRPIKGQTLFPIETGTIFGAKFSCDSDGSAYIFAMVDGSSIPGNRTFTLPAGIKGSTVEVVGEDRLVPVSGGEFSDGFGAESTYHVYKISL